MAPEKAEKITEERLFEDVFSGIPGLKHIVVTVGSTRFILPSPSDIEVRGEYLAEKLSSLNPIQRNAIVRVAQTLANVVNEVRQCLARASISTLVSSQDSAETRGWVSNARDVLIPKVQEYWDNPNLRPIRELLGMSVLNGDPRGRF